MHRKAWCLSFIVILSLISTVASAIPVDRVRYCRAPSWLPNCNGKTQDDYHWWNDYNVALEKQKRTYIARYSTPARGNVDHLVFISAGQRDLTGAGTLGLEGGNPPSFLTGAPTDFVTIFKKGDAWRDIGPIAGNLPQRMLNSGQLPANVTFMAAAWDARFNWGFSPSNKREIVDAYYAWLKSKFIRERLKSIYLAGHSRGGALVVELGRRFNRDFPEIPLIVHLLDGVPNANQDELGVSGTEDNPLTADSSFYAERIVFANHFPNINNLRVFNMVSGAQVLIDEADFFEQVRAFAQTGGSFDAGWLRQQWFTNTHNQFITGNARTNDAFNDFIAVHPGMVAARERNQPPSARCNGRLDYYIPSSSMVQGTFDSFGTVSNSGAPIVTWNWNFYHGYTGQGFGSATGPGPHTRSMTVYYQVPINIISASMQITDALGNSASTTCSFNY